MPNILPAFLASSRIFISSPYTLEPSKYADTPLQSCGVAVEIKNNNRETLLKGSRVHNKSICMYIGMASRPIGSNYRLGGGGAHIKQLQIGGGGHTYFFFKMTDLCNGEGGIFVQIIGGHGPPCPPPPIPTALARECHNHFTPTEGSRTGTYVYMKI